MTCWSIFRPVKTLEQWPFGKRGDHIVTEVADDKSLPKAERKRQYFDWARQVVNEMRGTHVALEKRFDRVWRGRP